MNGESCPNGVLTTDSGFRVWRVTMHCVTQGCMQRCTCSFFACKKEPDIGASFWKPNTCILHGDECAWRVKEYCEVPELTEVLCKEEVEE